MGDLFVQDSVVASEKADDATKEIKKRTEMKDSDKPAGKKPEKKTYSHDEAVEAEEARLKELARAEAEAKATEKATEDAKLQALQAEVEARHAEA